VPCRSIVFALVLLGWGCGAGGKFAKVSGRVTLDGAPLAGAIVIFQPLNPDPTHPLPGSHGLTDADGNYTLQVDLQATSGAAVGTHRVAISKTQARAGSGEGQPRDSIPARYNSASELTCEVPAGGTDRAHFELKSR
jgi:hypothetical protein